jgi:imidazolonepropionase-like amidohydrolase
MLFLACLFLGCASEASDSKALLDAYVLTGATVVGRGRADVEVADGRIIGLGTVSTTAERIDVSGRFLAPAFVDSHVHLAYLPEAAAMADGGISAAIDLAAPLSFLTELPDRPRVLSSGPMITAVDGYPTQSWGRNGYGLECADAAAVRAAVQLVVAAGARVVKVPVTSDPGLDDEELRAAVEEAHARGLKVAAHALSDDEAARAARAGVDVLAHTPIAPLSKKTIALWSGRAVISTLRAFGGSKTAVANLRALRDAGATVLYGTDFGNATTPGIDDSELELLAQAGLDGTAILDAATSAPAAFWGLEGFGRIEVGAEAHVLVLDADPTVDPTTLSRIVRVL